MADNGSHVSPVSGLVAPGFEAVREEFERNFTERGELGAACAAYVDGEKVVDLWGGVRDRHGSPWEEDTMVLMYSLTKGMAAIAMAVAASHALLDVEEPVATYWPEFADHGKEKVTVRHVLSHQSGLAAVDRKLSLSDLGDLDLLADVLERQLPEWEPGARQGYHYLTVGWLLSELLCLVDPHDRSLGRFFRDEVAAPLGLDFHIGLPPEIPDTRVARIKAFRGTRILLHPRSMPPRMARAYFRPGSLTNRVLSNPKISSPGRWDRPELWRIEIPAAGGVGTVRSVARAFGVLATGGAELQLTPEVVAAITEPAREPTQGWGDLVWHTDIRFSMGFVKPSPMYAFGGGERAIASEGAGGSLAIADPHTRSAFAYAPNRLGLHFWGDPRQQALTEAFSACVAGVG